VEQDEPEQLVAWVGDEAVVVDPAEGVAYALGAADADQLSRCAPSSRRAFLRAGGAAALGTAAVVALPSVAAASSGALAPGTLVLSQYTAGSTKLTLNAGTYAVTLVGGGGGGGLGNTYGFPGAGGAGDTVTASITVPSGGARLDVVVGGGGAVGTDKGIPAGGTGYGNGGSDGAGYPLNAAGAGGGGTALLSNGVDVHDIPYLLVHEIPYWAGVQGEEVRSREAGGQAGHEWPAGP